MAQAGNDGESEGQETITEHQEEYDNASSAPGSIGGDHEIRSEKLAFEDRRQFRRDKAKAERAFTVANDEEYDD